MSLPLGALVVVAGFLAASTAPGLVLLGRSRLTPLERLVAVPALSWIAVYLVSFLLFLLRAPAAVYASLLAVCALACVLERRAFVPLARSARARAAGAAYLLLAAWAFAHLCLVRHYAGAFWGGDWLEHAQRAAFFMGEFAATGPEPFVGGYDLAARPPFQNLLVAFFCRPVGSRFEFVSLASTCLSAGAFLPCALLLPRLGARRASALPILAALLALSPFFLENTTLPWTKLLSAFYVLAATAFYLRGRETGQAARLALAGGCFAAACLVHYSAVPFAIVALGHWFLAPAPARALARRSEAAIGVLASLPLLATWLAFSLAHSGWGATLYSNTAVMDSAGRGVLGNLVKIARNLGATLVPYWLRGLPLDDIAQRSRAGFLRDAAFLAYQQNLLLMPGLAGGPLAAGLLYRARRHVPWLALTAALGLAVASHGGLDLFGVAHVVLQPLALLAVALLAAGLPSLTRGYRRLAVAGAAVDAFLGIALHFHLENRVFRLAWDGHGPPQLLDDRGLVRFAVGSFWQKTVLGLSFWGDAAAPIGRALEVALVLGTLAILLSLARRLDAL